MNKRNNNEIGHLLGNLPQEKRQSSYLNPTIVSKGKKKTNINKNKHKQT